MIFHKNCLPAVMSYQSPVFDLMATGLTKTRNQQVILFYFIVVYFNYLNSYSASCNLQQTTISKFATFSKITNKA